MKKVICLTLCFLMCLTVLVSCKEDEPITPPPSGTTAPDENSTQAPPTEGAYVIKASDLASYAVVYPEDASEAVSQAAKTIGGAIMEKFSVQMTVKNDYFVDLEGSQYQKGEKEILVGITNREESGEYLGTLRYRDYGYALIGKKLVILGNHEAEVLEAAEAFGEYLTGLSADAEIFFAAENNKLVSGDYTHKDITLGGTSIADYRIVYPTGGNFEKSLATKLAYALAEDCGVFPAIVEDSVKYADGYEILVGVTNRQALPAAEVATGTGHLVAEGKLVLLAGQTAWGTATAVDAFIEAFESKTAADTLAMELPATAAPSASMTTMSFNLGGAADKTRTDAIIGVILATLPDTVGLQEAGAALVSIEGMLGAYYECVGEGDSYILFAKEKFNKVENGSIASGVVYASLTRKADSTALIHINAKLDESDAAARQETAGLIVDFIYANTGSAMLLTGDLACAPGSAEFLLLSGTNLANATFLCENPGDLTGGEVFDYILLDDYYMDIVSYERGTTTMYETTVSDRAPIVVEYTVNYAGTDMKEEPSDSMNVGRDDAGDDFKYPVIIH